jgi:hypothetical protein
MNTEAMTTDKEIKAEIKRLRGILGERQRQRSCVRWLVQEAKKKGWTTQTLRAALPARWRAGYATIKEMIGFAFMCENYNGTQLAELIKKGPQS